MADSSLMRSGESPPAVRKGHGTAELGPSDSTDSGSDVRGGPAGVAGGSVAGPGGRGLNSDTDREGTGERAAAGRDAAGPVDQTLYDEEGNAVDGEDIGDDASLDTTLQEPDDVGARLDEDRNAERIERDQVQPRRDVGSDVERGDVPVSGHRDRTG